MKFSFIFPGQGSQSLLMMNELAERFPVVGDMYQHASDILGFDLWTLCQHGPIEDLSDTVNTQPALLTAGVSVWRVWQELGGAVPTVMAGHSLGEYTALVAAGAIEFEQAVALVRDRGKYMQEAVPKGEGAMAAIIGLEDQIVRDVCVQNADDDVLQAVNFNAPGQVVIAGTSPAIERALVAMKEAGAKRAMTLPVSIPAHSSLMTPAAERLAERLSNIDIRLPEIPVLHNCNVQIAQSSNEIRDNLVKQLDSPVRWVDTINTMVKQDVTLFVESGPGRVLSGMVKRISKTSQTASMETPEALLQLIS